ncbi:MAG: ATP-binding protein [Spirochaetales bacterium]|jgi:predicted AAA+ superfamily ATPase|nr:ATP-binding protein [Spirochaetales bacterium]
MHERDCLKKIISFRDTAELIKVITGVRRCGKSSLLALFRDHLVSSGVKPSSILHINFEAMQYSGINSARALNDLVKAGKAKRGKTYVLLDEVQLVPEWERAVNSLRLDRGMDIYITGSNTHMLNSPLSTLLSGRYVEIRMLPLSFREFLVFCKADKKKDRRQYFEQYIQQGGFPGIFSFNRDESLIQDYTSGIYSTIVMKDIIRMNQIRDVDILEKIIFFLADNIGNPVSAKKIADYLTSTGRKTTADTTDNFLKMLESAYLFYRAKRSDIKGKRLMKINDKFFIVDLGLRNFLKGKTSDYGSTLENIVFLELLRRGYNVTVGKLDSLEVDFVAWKSSEQVYFQVTSTLTLPGVLERELTPLRKIPDNYKKVILSMDPVLEFESIDGIFHYNLMDFLLGGPTFDPG